MRLDELVGIKQQASDIIDKLKYKHEYTLQDIDYAKIIVTEMEDMGYKFLGSGNYGAAFKHPNGYVIKLVDNDPCYIDFVMYANKHTANPHLPKFKSKTIAMFGVNFYMVRMEHLEENPPEDQEYLRTIYTIIKYQTHIKTFSDLNDYLNSKENDKVYKKFLAKYEQELSKDQAFWETALQLRNLSEQQCNFDLHYLNSMRRPDKTRVIIDPWVTKGRLSSLFSGYTH